MCEDGYVIGSKSERIGDEDVVRRTCVSADSQCHADFGWYSYYRWETKSCQCMAGSFFDITAGAGHYCVAGGNYCQQQNGSLSEYDATTNSCTCKNSVLSPNSNGTGMSCRSCGDLMGSAGVYVASERRCGCSDGYTLDPLTSACVKNESLNTSIQNETTDETKYATISAQLQTVFDTLRTFKKADRIKVLRKAVVLVNTKMKATKDTETKKALAFIVKKIQAEIRVKLP